MIALPITEASAKVRTGGPNDDPADLDTAVWAGVLPLRLVAGDPQPVDGLRPDIASRPRSSPLRHGRAVDGSGPGATTALAAPARHLARLRSA